MEKTIRVINELKEKGIIRDYAIGGAIAALKWVEPFFTQDLDIFITLPVEMEEKQVIVLTPIYEYLKQKGFNWNRQWIDINGIPVEFLVADELEKKAISDAEVSEYAGVETKVITPEYLIALCLRTNRSKDKRKIEMLLAQSSVNREKLGKILGEFDLTQKFNEFEKKCYEK